MRYFIVLKRDGKFICGFQQEDQNDTIGSSARENIEINSLVCIRTNEQTKCMFTEVDFIPAKKLQATLEEKGFYPY